MADERPGLLGALAITNKTYLEQTNRVEERVEERWAKTEEKLEKNVNEAFNKVSAELKVVREEQKDLRSKVSMVLVVVCVLLLVVGPGDSVKALLAMLLKNFKF